MGIRLHSLISEHVLGVSIVGPGCKAVRVHLRPGNLSWAESPFSTPHGIIRVRRDRRADGSVKSKNETPKGVKIIR